MTVLGPELPQLAALAEGLDRDRATLTMRLTDLPMVEVLEVLRLG